MTDTQNLPAEINNVGTGLSDETLSEIRSFNDAFASLEKAGVIAENFSDYGTGFVVLPTGEKSRLLNVPFLIAEWRFTEGDNGVFVSAAIITKNDEKLIVNDGSTGICRQLMMVTQRRIAAGIAEPQKGLLCERGLTVSEYDYTDPSDGKKKTARTFYLSN